MSATDGGFSHKDGVSLHEHFDEKIAAIEKSIAVAHQAMDSRLEGMNEFRSQLQSQAGLFITRSEHESIQQQVSDLKDELGVHAGQGISRAEMESLISRINDDIRMLRESRALLEGKASRLSASVALAIAMLSLMLGVIGLLHTFFVAKGSP